MTQPEVLWFEDITIADVPSVGGKNASLGEMVRELGKSGVRVPAGFATTADAYRSFLAANGIKPAMREHIGRYHSNEASLQDTLQRHPGRGVRQALRWLLDRIERPYPACAGRGPGFGPARRAV